MSSWLEVIRSDWDALRSIELTHRSAEDQIEDKAVIDAMTRFEEDDDYPKSGYLSEYSDTDSDPYASD